MTYKTFFKFGAWAMLATGAIHSLNFLSDPQPANDSERQMLDLMNNYKMDLGAGIQRSMNDIVTFFNLSLTFLCLMGSGLNLLLVKFFDNRDLAKRVVTFNAIFWSIYLIPLWLMTFLPPEICFTIAWAGFAGAWLMMQRKG